MLGIKVAWSGLTAHIPDTVRISFTRKELALAPVNARRKDNGPKYSVNAPSLLATVDVAAHTPGFGDTDFGYLQYFSTGRAATALALRQKVRQAMHMRLDPNRQFIAFLETTAPEPGDFGRCRADLLIWLSEVEDGSRDLALQQWMEDEQGIRGMTGLFWVLSSETSEEDLCEARDALMSAQPPDTMPVESEPASEPEDEG